MPNFSGYFVSYWVVLLSTLVEVCDLLGEEQGVDGGELRTTGLFCTDVCHAIPGVLIEMLVGSNEEGLDLLPALVDGIGQGSISGIKTRCGVTFEHLSWKLSQNKVLVTLCPAKDRNIEI